MYDEYTNYNLVPKIGIGIQAGNKLVEVTARLYLLV